MTPEWNFDTKFGRFEANEILGKSFGSKIETKNDKGFGYVLEITPDLFTSTIKLNTQILYFADISQVLFNLELKKGSWVAESGTGSGSMTYSLANRVGREGKVFTFEYNKERADTVADMFKSMKMDQI